jgi:hypothetical protein
LFITAVAALFREGDFSMSKIACDFSMFDLVEAGIVERYVSAGKNIAPLQARQ